MIDISTILIAALNGLANGMLFFLIAVGLTIIFGVLNVLNFAHGSFYMLGAYGTFFFLLYTDGIPVIGSFWVALLVVPLVVAALGGLIEKFLLRPIYDADHIMQLLLTFGLVLALDHGFKMIWGSDFRSLSTPDALAFQIDILGRGYPAYSLFLILFGAVMAFAMWLLFTQTNIGKIVRAAAMDRETASALGINVPLVFTGVFVFGTVVTAIGGVLASPLRTIQPWMGIEIIIIAFVVVVLGGLGSFAGAFVAALLIGLLSSFTFIVYPDFEPIVPFLLMAVVLLIRPAGIFGVEEA